MDSDNFDRLKKSVEQGLKIAKGGDTMITGDFISDPCIICGGESDVGVGSGGYHYFACDKHWADIKRGKIELVNGEVVDEV